jgi:hypothetical protein
MSFDEQALPGAESVRHQQSLLVLVQVLEIVVSDHLRPAQLRPCTRALGCPLVLGLHAG